MNTNWLTLSKERRIEILNQATELTGLPSVAIEKDWWVTMVLNASFSLPYSKNIVFKGGTSLSKGWNLIERFSEDIDLAIDNLYNNIITHREKFNPLRGLEYVNHIPSKISILPPEAIVKGYERDYEAMTSFMIYGEPLKFDHLMKRILELQTRINRIKKN